LKIISKNKKQIADTTTRVNGWIFAQELQCSLSTKT